MSHKSWNYLNNQKENGTNLENSRNFKSNSNEITSLNLPFIDDSTHESISFKETINNSVKLENFNYSNVQMTLFEVL